LRPLKIFPLDSRMADPTRKFEYGACAFFITRVAAATSFFRIAEEMSDFDIVKALAIVNPASIRGGAWCANQSTITARIDICRPIVHTTLKAK
jgi:hypothetical protein